jgi:hypothetical protein
MKRGFITLAVGKDSYYELAYNLLCSYRATDSMDLPWTLVCDRENTLTAEFDNVILLENATCSYMDKLRLFSMTPYDQTIFIDADCLIYQNIDCMWDKMNRVEGIGGFGTALPLESQEGWFLIDDVGHWKNQLSFIPQMHGGICFIQKGPRLDLILDYAAQIEANYSEYKFKYFEKPADEPILALAMAAAGSMPVEASPDDFVFLPTVEKLMVNSVIRNRKAICLTHNGDMQDFRIVHFQNHNTCKSPYKVSCDILVHHIGHTIYFRRIVYDLTDLINPWFSRLKRLLLKIARYIHRE